MGRGEARPGAPVLAQAHVAVDAESGEIVASVLTDHAAGDASQVPILLEQIEGKIASVTADGAYDGEPVYQAVADHQADPPPDVVIPPRASAVASTGAAEAQSQRDRHVRFIAEQGRMAWQKATGYGRRSLAETTVGRYKAVIGPKLRARGLSAQQGEAAIAVAVLNRMIRVANRFPCASPDPSLLHGLPPAQLSPCNNAQLRRMPAGRSAGTPAIAADPEGASQQHRLSACLTEQHWG
jgi:hypothetical protein